MLGCLSSNENHANCRVEHHPEKYNSLSTLDLQN
jgi:hypothetical protein